MLPALLGISACSFVTFLYHDHHPGLLPGQWALKSASPAVLRSCLVLKRAALATLPNSVLKKATGAMLLGHLVLKRPAQAMLLDARCFRAPRRSKMMLPQRLCAIWRSRVALARAVRCRGFCMQPTWVSFLAHVAGGCPPTFKHLQFTMSNSGSVVVV